MDVVARVRMSGPLTCHRDGFAAELTALGYTDLSAANQLRLMADLSRWLEAEGVALDRIDRDVVDRFIAKRRRTHTRFCTEGACGAMTSAKIAASTTRTITVSPATAPAFSRK